MKDNIVDLVGKMKDKPDEQKVTIRKGMIGIEKPTDYDKEWNDLFFGTAYQVIKGKLYRVTVKDNGEIKQQNLANFAARIVKEIMRDNGQEMSLIFVIDGMVYGGHKLAAVQVPASKFNSMAWAVDAWGAAANPAPGSGAKDYLRHAIQHTGEQCERQTVYGHMGWRLIANQWYYLHGAGAVGDIEGKLSVDLSADNLERYSLPAGQVNYSAAMSKSLRILELVPRETFFTLWAVVFLAPLCEIMRRGNCEPSFLIWLLGHSGAMKSSVAALMLTHFGDFPNKLTLPANFKDTPNLLERKSFLVKDCLFVVDDFHPPTNKKEADRMDEAVQRLSRGYGDRHGRGRLNADSTAKKTYAAQGLCIITGEDVSSIGQSAAARQVVIELQKGDIDTETMTELQADAEQYSMAMRGFLEWLIPQMGTLPQQFHEQFIQLRKMASNDEQHKRVAEEISWLYMGFAAGLEYAASVGAIDEDKKVELVKESWQVFTDLGAKQAFRSNEEKTTVRFVKALVDLLATNTVWVKDIHGNDSEGQGQFIGWYDDQYYYLIIGKALSEVVKYYQAQGSFFNTTSQTLGKRLAQDGFINAVENQTSLLKKIEGKPRRVIYLRKACLKNL